MGNEGIFSLDLETRFNMSRKQEVFKTTKSGELTFYTYNLSCGFFNLNDLKNPLFQNLIDSYGKQLLIPLFQESPLYNKVNTSKDGKPKYDRLETYKEVGNYSGITGDFVDPCFLLLDSANTPLRFNQLVGYTLGYGLSEKDGVRELFEHKLWSDTDLIEETVPRSILDETAGKSAYFSGVGVAKEFQSKGGLGLILMHKFLSEYQRKGYNSIITRVKKGANNWSLFSGIDGDPTTAIPNTVNIAWYSNDAEGPKYRGIFLNDIKITKQYLENILEEKGTSPPG